MSLGCELRSFAGDGPGKANSVGDRSSKETQESHKTEDKGVGGVDEVRLLSTTSS